MEDEDIFSALEDGAHREWNRLSNQFTNAGYREGIIAGKESGLQEGFESGFTLGAPLGKAAGILRGRANAALAFLSSQRNSSPRPGLEHELRAIIDALASTQLHDLDSLGYHLKDDGGKHGDLLSLGPSDAQKLHELERAFEGMIANTIKPDLGELRKRLDRILVQLCLQDPDIPPINIP